MACGLRSAGHVDGVLDWCDLERFFVLDDADKSLIGDRRGDHSRLGFIPTSHSLRVSHDLRRHAFHIRGSGTAW
ncbi:MAG: DUF4158 domain-containing protein [Actinobacteria bacterium]|nr:DUF4158 domain-containing protein [Actinomycetota bacterium]